MLIDFRAYEPLSNNLCNTNIYAIAHVVWMNEFFMLKAKIRITFIRKKNDFQGLIVGFY